MFLTTRVLSAVLLLTGLMALNTKAQQPPTERTKIKPYSGPDSSLVHPELNNATAASDTRTGNSSQVAQQFCLSGSVTRVTPGPPPRVPLPPGWPRVSQSLNLGDEFRLTVFTQSQSCGATDSTHFSCSANVLLQAQSGKNRLAAPREGPFAINNMPVSNLVIYSQPDYSARSQQSEMPYRSTVTMSGPLMLNPSSVFPLSIIFELRNYPVNLLASGKLPTAIPIPTPELMPPGASLSLFAVDGYGKYDISFTGQKCAETPCIPPISAILAVGPHHQEMTNWCWAAIGEMVMKFIRPSMNITQCLQANQAFNLTGCCQLPRSAECNKPWHVLLRENDFAFDKSTGPITFDQVKEEIGCAKRPVIVYWKHRGIQDAHFVLAIGYNSQRERMQQVLVIDPESGSDDEHIYQWIPYQSSSEPLRRQFVGSWFESETFDIYAITDSK